MSKVTVNLKFQTDADIYEIRIDEKTVVFGGGKADLELGTGKNYSLTWFIQGEEGSEYTLKILSPPQTEFAITRTLDSSKKDAGQKWINL